MAQTVVIEITARFTDETSKGLGKAKQSSDKLGDSLRRTQQQADKLGKSKSELSLKDKATQVIEKVNKSLKSITSKAWNLTVKVLDKATAPIRGIFNLLKNPIIQAGAVLGVSIGVKDTIDTYANFEATMSKVQAISSAGVKEITAINAKAKEVGATTKFTATQAGEAFTYMAMAGWKAEQMLGGIDGVMKLAASSGEDVALVSDIVTDSMTAFGIAADGFTNGINNVTHFADVLAAASSNSNTNVAMLGESFKYAGALAGQFKFSIEDTALALGLMANSGIKASNSGTALRKIFTQFSSDFEIKQANGLSITVETTAEGKMRSLKDIIDDTRAAFNGMSKDEKNALENNLSNTAKGLGINLTNDEGELKTQAQLYDEVTEHANGLTDAGKVAEAEALAGKTAMAGLLSVLGASEKDYQKLADAVYNADGTAAKMAAIMMDNLLGDMILFQSAADGVKIAFMEKLNPYLRSFVKWITNKMPDVSKIMEKTADKISNGIDKLKDKIQDFTSTKGWKNADFFGKINISWNNIIAEPFAKWWNSSGKEFIAEVAAKIGNGLGKLYNGGIRLLLGLTNNTEDGVDIGKSFADGFIKGFNPKEIGGKILEGLKSIFNHSYLNPFGEDKDIFSTAVSGLIASKAAGGIASTAMTGLNIAALGKIALGAGIGGAGTAATGAGILGSATSMTGLLGLGSSATIALGGGNLAGGASLSAGALSGIGLGIIASIASISAGTISSINDISDGFSSYRKKDKLDKFSQAGAKGGMIASGAGIGALAGSVIPGVGTLIGGILGAGVGGIGALLTGDSVGKGISDIIDGTSQIRKMSDALYEASENADKLFNKDFTVNTLVDEYRKLDSAIKEGKSSIEERTSAELRQKEIVQQLHDIYPNIITQYDVGLGKLSSQLGTIIEISAIDKEIAISKLEAEVQKGKQNLPLMQKNLAKSDEELQQMDLKKNNIKKYMPEISRLHDEGQILKKEKELATVKNDPEMIKQADAKLEDLQLRVTATFEKIKNTNEQGFGDIAGLGFTGFYSEQYFEDFFDNYTEYQQNYTKFLEAQAAEIENNKNIQNGFIDILEAKKKISEQELGMSLEEGSKNFYKLDDYQKGIFIEAIRNLKELADELDGIPPEKKIQIDMLFNVTKKALEGPELLKPNMFSPSDSGKKFNLSSLGINSVFPKPYATGGILTKPHVGLVAEAGPEAIIPLSGANKEHGISLWQKTGAMLGLLSNDTIEKHAHGGIFGDTANLKNNSSNRSGIYTMLDDLKNNSQSKNSQSKNVMQNNNPISISLGGINFTFNATGATDKDSIMQTIRQQMPEIADDVSQAIAEKLKRLFFNMKAGII